MAKKSSKQSNGSVQGSSASRQFKFPDALNNLNTVSKKFEYVPIPERLLDDKVIIIKKFWPESLTQELCANLSQPGVMELFLQRGTKEYAERCNERFSTDDTRVAQLVWQKLYTCLAQDEYILKELEFSQATGLNPQIRAYRYEKGHKFAKHYDSSFKVPNSGTTRWTLLIYLTGGNQLVGGDTVFYSAQEGEATAVHPEVGMALLHKHGDDCLLHEAKEVFKGVKWVLRSDVVFL
ncbi:LAME_0G16226g1_1 [Lachancea meyersii CBS 8951]|uniref:LAME_0G16226g1_1 n=1 Tax=Lachancea meyersii CBS 8951 TaxID=1266667 RepID=A0A1G4KB16_9SACH|nr:LAME_0G16226g1_1 [Lachancea meyersii CBS 8951]